MVWDKLRWLTVRGIGRIAGTVYEEMSPNYLTGFNKAIFGDPSFKPGSVPKYMDNNPDVFTDQIPKLLKDIIPEIWLKHKQNNSNLDSQTAKRSVYVAGETGAEGHSVISFSFQKNTKVKELIKDPNLLLHPLVGFSAGGGILVPNNMLSDTIIGGRKLKRFPSETFYDKYPDMQKYMSEVVKSGELLVGKVALLGQNAIYFKNHEITSLPNGGDCQILRPQTILPHVVDGQGIWIAVSHPELPDDVIVYAFIGHGQHPTGLGDFVNAAFAGSVWQMSFRAGNLSAQNFEIYKNTLGDKAYMLGTDPDYKLLLNNDLLKMDPLYRAHILLLSSMETYGGIPLRWTRDYLGPNTCPVPPEKMFLAVANEALDDCETGDFDFDAFADAVDSGDITTLEEIDKMITDAKTVHTRAGMYDLNGTPYSNGMGDMTLSIPKGTKNTFESAPTDMFGLGNNPLDQAISDTLKENLTDVSWDEIENNINTYISDQIGDIVKAFDPFKDGSSVDSLTKQYLSNDLLMESIQKQLHTEVETLLGSKSGEIKSIIKTNSTTKDLDLIDYPFEESISAGFWEEISSSAESSSSYVELRITEALAAQKVIYISLPENKAAIQKDIANRLKTLGDLSTLDKDLASTKAELDAKNDALNEVVKKLILNPNDQDLIEHQNNLNSEIEKQTKELEELEKKKIQADEINREQSNLDSNSLDQEGKDAKDNADERGSEIFKGAELANV